MFIKVKDMFSLTNICVLFLLTKENMNFSSIKKVRVTIKGNSDIFSEKIFLIRSSKPRIRGGYLRSHGE